MYLPMNIQTTLGDSYEKHSGVVVVGSNNLYHVNTSPELADKAPRRSRVYVMRLMFVFIDIILS